MRKKQILVAILALSLMAPIIISSASATDYVGIPLFLDEPNLFTANEMIWIVDIKLFLGEKLSFDGQDVIIESLVYEYNLEGSTIFLPITGVSPTKVSKTDSMVKIWWNSDELQEWRDDLGEVVIQHIGVKGDIEGGDTFFATGPGFTHAFRPR